MKKNNLKLIAFILVLSLVFSSVIPVFAAASADPYSVDADPELLFEEETEDISVTERSDVIDPGADIIDTYGKNNTDVFEEPDVKSVTGGKDDPESGKDDSGSKDDPEAGKDDSGNKYDPGDEITEEPVYETGLYNVDGIWKYYKNGKFSRDTGAVRRADTGEICYVKKGIFSESTGVVKSLFDDERYYVKDGIFTKATGLAKSLSGGKRCYVKKGVFTKATGVVKSLFDDERYYVKNGVFTKATGLAKSLSGGKPCYVQNGVFTEATGLAKSLFGGKPRYVKNGVSTKSTGLAKSLFGGKPRYVKNGVFTKSTGLVKSLFDDERYYVKNGIFTKSTGITKSLFNNSRYYVKNGVFTKSTGVAKSLTDKKRLFVKNGIFTKATGVAESLFDEKYYYVKNGVFANATGVADVLNDSGYRYVKNGIGNALTGYAERISDGRLFYLENGIYNGSLTALPDYTGNYNGRYYDHSYLLTGFRLIGRDCYYYRNGSIAGNTTADGLNIDASGKAVSPLNNLILLQSRLIVDSITDDSMSLDDKMWICFNYVISINETRGNPRIPHYTGLDWPYVYANDIFGSRNGGNCFSYAAAFAFLAKACGCKDVFACSSGGHGWTEADGKLYDPEQYLDGVELIYGVSIYDSSVSDYKRSISLTPDGSYMHVRIPEI